VVFVRHNIQLTRSKGVTINSSLRQKDKEAVNHKMGQKRPALQKQTRAKEVTYYQFSNTV
jgi:hypothetical protein